MIEIKDINNPSISFYKSLRFTPVTHIKGKLFITEGEKTTLQLLKSDFEIISVFAVPEFYENNKSVIAEKNLSDDSQYFADKTLMNQIVGFRLHSGVMAIAKQPEQPLLNELSFPIIVLNGIINSENVGSIIRNCAAFGVNSIIVDKQTSSPYLRRAVRVSMGSLLSTNIFFSENLIFDLMKLKELSYSIISAEINDKSIPIKQIKFPDKFALVFGNEGKGICREILDISDYIVHIPITDKVPSINVASSSAVILSEIFGQKKKI